MKYPIFFLTALCFMLTAMTACAQDDPIPTGYKLRKTRDLIRVYQQKSNRPNLDKYNLWDSDYWFLTDSIIKIGTIDYVKLYIPSGSTGISKTTKAWLREAEYIDSDDFNSWLYITKADFDKYKIDNFPRFSGKVILTALTIPFKIHPAFQGHSSSIYNSSFNAGTFLGYRLAWLNNGGVSVGGMLGISSLDQNKSNNISITDATNQSMFASNYGAGVIFDVAKKFQLGAVIGWDHGYGDLSSTYIYQKKSWFAISLNYNFLSFGTNNIQK